MLEGVPEASFFREWETQMAKDLVGADEDGNWLIRLRSEKISLDLESEEFEYLNGIVRNRKLEAIKMRNKQLKD